MAIFRTYPYKANALILCNTFGKTEEYHKDSKKLMMNEMLLYDYSLTDNNSLPSRCNALSILSACALRGVEMPLA